MFSAWLRQLVQLLNSLWWCDHTHLFSSSMKSAPIQTSPTCSNWWSFVRFSDSALVMSSWKSIWKSIILHHTKSHAHKYGWVQHYVYKNLLRGRFIDSLQEQSRLYMPSKHLTLLQWIYFISSYFPYCFVGRFYLHVCKVQYLNIYVLRDSQ